LTWRLADPLAPDRPVIAVSTSAPARRRRRGPRRRAGRVPGGLEDLLQLLLVVAQLLLGVVHGDVAAADQLLGVELPDAALGVDDLVHPRVGHRRVVALVVPAAAVADQVDHDVLVERLAVFEGQPGDPDDGLGSSPFTWKIGAWIIRATSVE
jgi:hypothetical protein